MFSLDRLVKIWEKYQSFYWNGLQMSLIFAVIAVFIGLTLGLILASGRILYKNPRDNLFAAIVKMIVRLLCTAYVEVFRATPMLVQVFIIYYGPGMVLKIGDSATNRMTWGVVAMGLNSAAYLSEVIRSGIGAVPGGQMEAARCVGMSHWKAMRYVVLPQAVRNILPALCNEFVTIIKETSILGMVGITELMFRSQTIATQSYIFLEPYIIAACMYFVVVFTLSKIISAVERRMSKSVTR